MGYEGPCLSQAEEAGLCEQEPAIGIGAEKVGEQEGQESKEAEMERGRRVKSSGSTRSRCLNMLTSWRSSTRVSWTRILDELWLPEGTVRAHILL